jgi:hypothetical protein
MSELPDEDFMNGLVSSTRPYVTVTQGLRGHFAVLMYWNDEDAHGTGPGFWDVFQSGIGSYNDRAGAAREAREWADAEGLECRV